MKAGSLTSITGTNSSVMVSTAVPERDVSLDQYFSKAIFQQITSKILQQSSGEIASRCISQPENTTALINKHTQVGSQSGHPDFTKNENDKKTKTSEGDKRKRR